MRGMRAAWQETLLAAGVPEGRLHLNRKAAANQLGAVAAAGLTPSQLKAVPQTIEFAAAAEQRNNAAGELCGAEPDVAAAAAAISTAVAAEAAPNLPVARLAPDAGIQWHSPLHVALGFYASC